MSDQAMVREKRTFSKYIGIGLAWLSVMSVWLVFAVAWSKGVGMAEIAAAAIFSILYCALCLFVIGRTRASPRLKLHLRIVVISVFVVVVVLVMAGARPFMMK